ncbi:transposase family protein [Nonomuraea dietziae]|uniref:transposase family protein n=1 Tax=Nonomuraea dietziae TaxID=65515 RepID=UPI003F4D11BF
MLRRGRIRKRALCASFGRSWESRLRAPEARGARSSADPRTRTGSAGRHNQILGPDNRTFHRLPRAQRCLGERGFALLKGRWRTLQHITISPGRIGDIARAALVLTHVEHNHLAEIH